MLQSLVSHALVVREQQDVIAAIFNAAFMVRYYAARGRRSRIGQLERKQAIQLLGLRVREALNEASDYEPIITALADGLRSEDNPTF